MKLLSICRATLYSSRTNEEAKRVHFLPGRGQGRGGISAEFVCEKTEYLIHMVEEGGILDRAAVAHRPRNTGVFLALSGGTKAL